MKKFFMVTPQQLPGNLNAVHYEPQGNSLLEYGDNRFPIVPVINGYADEGETVKLITITYAYDSCAGNLAALEQELRSLKEVRNIDCSIESVEVPADDSVPAALHVFQELVNRTEDDDVLHACITFGSKPMPLILVMAMQYAYRLKRNASIDCIVYGAIDFNDDKRAKIYDMTALVKLDEIVRVLADRNVENPESIIAQILEG